MSVTLLVSNLDISKEESNSQFWNMKDVSKTFFVMNKSLKCKYSKLLKFLNIEDILIAFSVLNPSIFKYLRLEQSENIPA